MLVVGGGAAVAGGSFVAAGAAGWLDICSLAVVVPECRSDG